MSKLSIFCHTQSSFSNSILALLGKGGKHASSLYAHWFKKGAVSAEDPWIEKQSKALVGEILDLVDFSLPTLSLIKEEGETSKFLLKFNDGRESESVLIPMKSGITLCISSQIGCKMGCAFCETAKMGLIRSLSCEEIVGQVFYARHVLKRSVRNIVFMGMGEPFDNLDEVLKALKVLTEPAGLSFGPSRITVSTSGLVDGILRFKDEADPAINLAVSVNAPNDLVRKRLMPVNKTNDMQALKEALLLYCSHPRRQIFAEYVMIKGINDSLEAADQLTTYLEGLRARVNLIPYNPQSRGVFMPSDEETIRAFAKRVRERGFQTLLRLAKGQKIMAACGQLGRKSIANLIQTR